MCFITAIPRREDEVMAKKNRQTKVYKESE
jgi:hypothetical protein